MAQGEGTFTFRDNPVEMEKYSSVLGVDLVVPKGIKAAQDKEFMFIGTAQLGGGSKKGL